MVSKFSGLTLPHSIKIGLRSNLFFFICIYLSQVLSKFIFVLISFPFHANFNVFIETLNYGFGMDIAVTASLFLVFSVLRFIHQFYPITQIVFGFFILFLMLNGWILVADINFFHFWRWRIQSQAFDYLTDFQIVATTLPIEIWIYTLLLIICTFIGTRWLIKVKYSYFERKFNEFPTFNWKKPFYLLVWGLMFILIRGGVGPAVRTWGDVMKSSNSEISVASMNGLWNFGYVISSPSKDDQVKRIMVSMDWENTVADIYKGRNLSPDEMKKTWIADPRKSPKYCFVIVLEGVNAQWFENENLGLQLNAKGMKDFVYFNQCYAVGDRTDKGLAAILAGWPGEPGKGILHDPSRWQFLKGMPQILKSSGWNTNFIYGGDAKFSNMNGFMQQMGVTEVYDQTRINAGSNKIKWGYTDMAVGDWLAYVYLPNLVESKQPVFQKQVTVWLQLASHEPFDVVNAPLSMVEKYKLSIKHSDSAVNDFVRAIKNRGIWNESVIVVVSDHGRDLGLLPTNNPCEFFRIPLFVGGGAVNLTSLSNLSQVVCSQTDIYATLSFLLSDTQNYQSLKSDYFSYPWIRTIGPDSKDRMVLSFNGERSVLLGERGFSEGVMQAKSTSQNQVDSIRIGIQSKIIRSFFRF